MEWSRKATDWTENRAMSSISTMSTRTRIVSSPQVMFSARSQSTARRLTQMIGRISSSRNEFYTRWWCDTSAQWLPCCWLATKIPKNTHEKVDGQNKNIINIDVRNKLLRYGVLTLSRQLESHYGTQAELLEHGLVRPVTIELPAGVSAVRAWMWQRQLKNKRPDYTPSSYSFHLLVNVCQSNSRTDTQTHTHTGGGRKVEKSNSILGLVIISQAEKIEAKSPVSKERSVRLRPPCYPISDCLDDCQVSSAPH